MAAAAQIVPKSYLEDFLLKGDALIGQVRTQILFDQRIDGIWTQQIVEKITNYPTPLPTSISAFRKNIEAAVKNASDANIKKVQDTPGAPLGLHMLLIANNTDYIEQVRQHTCKKFCGEASIAISFEKQAQELENQLDGPDFKGLRRKTIVTFVGLNDHVYKKSFTEPSERNNEEPKECGMCTTWETTALKLKQCGTCKKMNYCNKECQRAHWSEHKLVCVKTP